MRDIFVLLFLIWVTVWLVPIMDRVEIIKDQSEQRITRLESIGK
jgi:hypothetical protein